ncbi:TRAP transporter large permease subunit, partial [Cohnella sp. REN36]|uniref:TRAP transporter large permease subunit n=1 Tax=Cohnella sp. REN36 TaxID=2887347 RepID=UPI00351CEF3C
MRRRIRRMVLTLFSSFLVMMLLRVPIAISLSLATVFVLMQSDFNMNMVPQRMFSALDSFP